MPTKRINLIICILLAILVLATIAYYTFIYQEDDSPTTDSPLITGQEPFRGEVEQVEALQKKWIRLMETGQEALIAHHNIQVTTDEIRATVEESLQQLSEEEIEQMIATAQAQVKAIEAVLDGEMTVEQAAAEYLPFPGSTEVLRSMMLKTSKEDLAEMKAMTPYSKEDVIEKSISGWRDIVEAEALANIILPATITAKSTNQPFEPPAWKQAYEHAVFLYATENLLGKNPTLDDISSQDVENMKRLFLN